MRLAAFEADCRAFQGWKNMSPAGPRLALRIPAEVVRRPGLRVGATVEAQLTVHGAWSIRPPQWDRKAFAIELTESRSAMPMSEPVIQELRSRARY